MKEKNREKDLETLVINILGVFNKFDLRHVKNIRFEDRREREKLETISGGDIFGLTVYDKWRPKIYLKANKDKKSKTIILLHEILHGVFPNASEDYCYRESERLYDLIYNKRRKNG